MIQNSCPTTKLCSKMCRSGYEEFQIERVKKLVDELQQRRVQGTDRFVRRLMERVADKQGYFDILMEGRFALVLARNRFSHIQIEYSGEGPDLKASYYRRPVYFEVTRRHSKVDEWAEQSQDDLPPPDDPENIIGRIQNKMSQLRTGEVNVLVFWSDTVAVLKREMQEAFEYIVQEVSCNPGVYGKLSGVLFTTGGVDSADLKQFYLFVNDKASKPLPSRLTRKLESLCEENRKRLQRRFDRLAIAMRELCDSRAQQINNPEG
jgi:hypothetical protein